MNQALFLFFVAATCAACSESPAPGKYTAECYVRYLKPENQLFAEAVLREERPGIPDPQPLIPSGGVRYMGTLMREAALQGTPMYRLEQNGGYASDHQFAWTDNQKRTHNVNMSLSPITAFSFDADPISIKKPATFTWTGAPLESGETLVFMWERVGDRQTIPMEILGTPGQSSIQFPAAQLAKVAPGIWTLSLVRKKTTQTEAQGTSVVCTAEYYTDADTVVVQDF